MPSNDVYIVITDGWKQCNRPFFEIDENRKTYAIMDKQVKIKGDDE